MYDVDYYKQDKQFGERCLCDGINLYEAYNADLVSYQYTRGKLTTEYQQEPGLSGLLFFDSEFAVGELEIVFYVGESDRNDVDKNISGLVTATKNCILNFEPFTIGVCLYPQQNLVGIHRDASLTGGHSHADGCPQGRTDHSKVRP